MRRQGTGLRVILLHPPLKSVLSAATPEYVSENAGCLPPMGLLYLQAAVENSSHESILLDANAENLTHEAAARQAVSHEPDVVGIQAMTFTMPDAYRVAKEIKRLRPDVVTVLGGPHPTIYPQETAALPAVDYAFSGEGEIGFIRFLDRFDDPDARAAVAGLASHGPNGARYQPGQGLLEDLDALKFPARRSSPWRAYTSVLAQRNPVTVMITSRGCPFQCIFCNRMGRTYRYHSARYVLEEMEQIAAMGIGEVFIHDDTFTLKRDRIEAICRGLIDRKLGLIWEGRTRVDCVDRRLLSLMKEAGCKRLSFGVESGSPRVLKAIRKNINLDRAKAVFRWCRQEGIRTLADFMVGNLSETEEDLQMTIDFARRLRPDYVQFSICSPYPGTPLYELAMDKGLVDGDIWRDFARDPLKEFHSPVWTENFTPEELAAQTASCYRSFYFRPRFILRQLTRVSSLKSLGRMGKAAWGMLTR